MSKFCPKCGSKLNDIAVFCEICGQKQPVLEETLREPEVLPEILADELQEEQAPQEPQMPQTKKKPAYFWVGIVGGAVSVLLVLILTILFAGAPYDRAVANIFDLNFNGNAQKIRHMAPEEFWDYWKDVMHYTADDAIEAFEEDEVYESTMDLLQEQYGKKLKCSYEITEAKELSKKKLDSLRDELKERYDISKRSVTNAYELEMEVTFDGRQDTGTEDYELIVVEINGNWYCVTSAGDFKFYL